MSLQQRSPFNFRAFAAWGLALSSLGLPVTGLMNHGYGFEPMSQVRHAWMAAHNVLGMLAVVFGVWHVALNFRALAGYALNLRQRLLLVSRELLLASAVVVVLTGLFVGHAFHME